MLTKDLLRYKIASGDHIPFWLGRSERNISVAARLVATWQEAIGRRRAEVSDDLMLALGSDVPSSLGKGLVRTMEESATWTEPASQENFRATAFDIAAKLLQNPCKNHIEHLDTVAKQLPLSGEELAQQMYNDLPDDQTLTTVEIRSAEQLLDAYNLGLAQGFLLNAQSMNITMPASAVAEARRILKALRFLHLLALPKKDGGNYEIEVSGPLSILEQQSRYGLQFAQLLPHLTANRHWQLRASLRPPRLECETTTLRLSNRDPLKSASFFTAFIPPEIADLQSRLAAQRPDWRLHPDPEPLLLAGGEIVLPDFSVTTEHACYSIELFHPWHAAALKRRREQQQQGLLPHFILGVTRKLAAKNPTLAEGNGLFLFSDIPSPRALIQALSP